MRARVLGGLELEADGEPLMLPAGRVGGLLRTLLVRPNEIRPSESLCETLWPGTPFEIARPRLHVTVSRLRSFLSHSTDGLRMESYAEGYQLHATADSLDILAFEEVAARALADGDSGAVEEALAQWGGEPYAEFEWTADVRNQRSRLSDMHRRLVEAKLNRAESDGAVAGFVRSKFRAPMLADGSLLERRPLLESVPDVGEVGLVAVTAPAGFGKSLFLSQWAHRQSVPVVWVTMDPEDNDPVRFWSGVVGAIVETDRPDLEASTSELREGSAAFLDAVCDVLKTAGESLAVVLDDFHLVTNPVVVEQVAEFVSALPESATIALASRVAPAFPTASLGASGRLHSVGASALSFSVDEVETLVGDRAQAESLWRLTEGWPVAVMALRAADAVDMKVTGAEEMAQYLVEEVLEAVPADVKTFLLEIVFLDRFNAVLCNLVTGRDDAGEMIRWLQTHQFFILEYESTREWFRLHQLIAAELRRRAQGENGTDHAAVERRAAEWFLEQGMAEESLRYAVRARDRKLISATASKVLGETALRQETRACVGWLESIDPDDLADDLRGHSIATCLAAIWAPRDLRLRWAHSRSRSFGGDDDVVLAFHDAVVSVKEGRSTEAVELFERVINEAGDYAADAAPDLVGVLVGMAFANLVEARMFQDALQPDDPLFSNAIGLIRPSAPAVATFTLSFWALVAFAKGSYQLAESLADEYYQGRRQHDVIRQPTPVNTVVGALKAAQNAPDPKHFRRLAEGIEDLIDLYELLGSYTWVTLTLLVTAALYRAGGDLETASLRQRRADTLLRTLPDAPFLVRFASSVEEIVAGQPPEEQVLIGELTPRERQVFAYLATDMTIEQIADALYLSPSTIRNHAASIYRKLGVRSRHRAVLKVGIDNIDLSVVAADSGLT